MDVHDHHGNRFRLERDIAGGGEARIWTIRGHPDLVAKIYHTPTRQHEAKLTAMLANPPTQPKTHIAIAWPIAGLYKARLCVGFLMPHVQSSAPIFQFYHPVKRQQLYPGFTWRYLHRTGLNLMIAAEAIHAKGHVIGDVNESNILVNSEALVTLVDTDSFRVTDGKGGIYPCPVGKPEYTPPELQGVDFKTIDRHAAHDHFGLAVLLFHLLMQGFHPFAGVMRSQQSLGRVDLYAISHGFFPYQPNPSLKPPPHAPAFDILHPELQAAFRRCFVEGHRDPARRPTAREWQWVLEKAENALVPCTREPHHVYSRHLQDCPWCALPVQRLGSASVTMPAQQPLPAATAGTAPRRPLAPQQPPVSRRPVSRARPRAIAKVLQAPPQSWSGKLRLLGQWIGMSAVGGAIGSAVGLEGLSAWGVDSMVAAVVRWTASWGMRWGIIWILIGFAQWCVLRSRLQHVGWWPWASAIGGALAMLGRDKVYPAVGDVGAWTALGTIIGIFHWLVLWRQVASSCWWLGAAALAGGGFWAGYEIVYLTVDLRVYEAFYGTMLGTVYGVTTGPVLLWLLPRRVP